MVYTRRLKKDLEEIIGETQTGFMSNRHISSNIRLVLDLLDYSDNIDNDSLIVFLDFYKAFDTIEHYFLFKMLQTFGFGQNFVSTIEMFYKDIDSCVIHYQKISSPEICPSGLSDFAFFFFLIVIELLSLHILNNPVIKGLSIFGKEVRLTQLADDTALFLKDKNEIETAISLIEEFSAASGLKLNKFKCEILCLYETNVNTVC